MVGMLQSQGVVRCKSKKEKINLRLSICDTSGFDRAEASCRVGALLFSGSDFREYRAQ